MKTDEVIAEFRKIKQEYSYNPDIMNEEDERLTRVKKIIDQKLSLADKTIILLYVDCQSYRKLGARLGVSHMTLRREVQRIKNIILKEYENNH
jgi:DNA-directed RNA polymerase specialized sigma24 family protein